MESYGIIDSGFMGFDNPATLKLCGFVNPGCVGFAYPNNGGSDNDSNNDEEWVRRRGDSGRGVAIKNIIVVIVTGYINEEDGHHQGKDKHEGDDNEKEEGCIRSDGTY